MVRHYRHNMRLWLLGGIGLLIAILLVAAFFLLQPGKTPGGAAKSSSYNYYVSPSGNDTSSGTTPQQPLQRIQKALELAKPGDSITLAAGEYPQNITTVRSGTKDARITIRGSRESKLTGADSGNRIIEITHSYITLEGFHIDGKHGNGEHKEDYRDKLVYIIGTKARKGAEGIKLSNMLIENAGGECVRMRYFAKNNEIADSTIRNCGVYDFRFYDGGKNGEGIYIGTAPEQLKDGKNPTADPDISTGNYIHHNTIETYGNECVDVKEAATQNLIEHNTCRFQMDPNSAGLDSRGEKNTFRFNIVTDTLGAGVRLGGDGPKNGTGNNVYGNTFERNQDKMLNIQRFPQGKICGNKGEYQGSYADRKINPTDPCKD